MTNLNFYIIRPHKIVEKRTFTKEDFEYIKNKSNFLYPSVEINKQLEEQKELIKSKYGSKEM
jgi:hypothetical protein